MSVSIALRSEFDAAALRVAAKLNKDAAQGRRLWCWRRSLPCGV